MIKYLFYVATAGVMLIIKSITEHFLVKKSEPNVLVVRDYGVCKIVSLALLVLVLKVIDYDIFTSNFNYQNFQIHWAEAILLLLSITGIIDSYKVVVISKESIDCFLFGFKYKTLYYSDRVRVTVYSYQGYTIIKSGKLNFILLNSILHNYEAVPMFVRSYN